MAEQVNPTGSLAPGLPSVLVAAVTPKTGPERPRSARAAEAQPQGAGARSVADELNTPEAAQGKLNSFLQRANSELEFQVDEGTGRTFFKVVNQSTGEVLLQVPSKEMLAMARKLREFQEQTGAAGVLVDKEG